MASGNVVGVCGSVANLSVVWRSVFGCKEKGPHSSNCSRMPDVTKLEMGGKMT